MSHGPTPMFFSLPPLIAASQSFCLHAALLRLLLPSSSSRLLNHLSSSPSGLQFVRAELEDNNSLRSIPSTTRRRAPRRPADPSTGTVLLPVPGMGKKGLVSIFSRLVDSAAPTSSSAAAAPPWQWPGCGTNPQTASFRAGAGAGDDEPCCTATAAAAGRRRGPCAGKPTTAMGRGAAPGEMYKTVNSVFLDDPAADDFFSLVGNDEDEGAGAEGGLYLHDNDDDDDDGFSTTTASEEWSEAVIRSLGRTSTDRFFFDPGPLPASNSILATTAAPNPEAAARKTVPASTEEESTTVTPGHNEADENGDVKKQRQPTTTAATSLAERSVAVAVDSSDPYGDFRASMEEMVSAHGLRDWAQLEELLAWYLRINGKQHHHLIVGAFVDLLLGLSSSPSSPPSSTAAETSTSTTTTTTTSSTSTSCSYHQCIRCACTAAATTSVAGDAVTAAAAGRRPGGRGGG